MRRARLTASKFGTVVKRRKNFEGLVESILYKPPPNSVAALEWGRSHEDIAKQLYITAKTQQFGELYQVTRSGIHISIEHPWLAASPDGHVVDPSESIERRYGILEIKCPYSARRVLLAMIKTGFVALWLMVAPHLRKLTTTTTRFKAS